MCIKKKARILIPESCVLIGVIDDKGILEENEVFVSIRKDNFSERSMKRKRSIIDSEIDLKGKTLTGKVLVTRNPCTHPGDLRLLTAVDKPGICSDLINVVVFSSKGDRPQCNKMAGGDLDGDVFFICWD
jgi:RNA-dependent RNA polymerase